MAPTAGASFVRSYRLNRAILLSLIAVGIAMAEAPQRRASAQGKLDARYVVTLSGLPIGQGAWVIEIGDDSFTASASGATAGLLRVFASGQGQSAARGAISGGQLVPSTYASHIVTDQKTDDVRMVLSGGAVKELAANPPTVASPDRVPVTEAHRRGVSDPMTATLIRVPGNGDMLGPQACQRTLSIFDGRTRYDLQLAFKRLDRVTSERGYQGVAVVCAVSFSPIAGHVRPHREYARVGPLPRDASDPARPRSFASDPVRLYAPTEPGDRKDAMTASESGPAYSNVGCAGRAPR
jgi:Protein of unknown function (DUF3108)